MNKVILLGRLVKDPEIRYTQGAAPLAVARYTLAVSRRFQKEGEPEADFINCVAFGKSGEFAEKYLRKGQQIVVVGRLQVRAWEDRDGGKHWSTEVITEEQYFTSERKTDKPAEASLKSVDHAADFYPIDESVEEGDDLPF